MTTQEDLNAATDNIARAVEAMRSAATFLPVSRELSIAKTNFDTALLWLAEAMNIEQRKLDKAEEIKDKPKML